MMMIGGQQSQCVSSDEEEDNEEGESGDILLGATPHPEARKASSFSPISSATPRSSDGGSGFVHALSCLTDLLLLLR